MSLRVNPGPIKEDLFFLADTHRVRALFANIVADNAWERITCMSPIMYFDFDLAKPYDAVVLGAYRFVYNQRKASRGKPTWILKLWRKISNDGNLIGAFQENAQHLEPLRDLASDFMRIVNQRSLLNYCTTHLTTNNAEFGGDTVPKRARGRIRTHARRQEDGGKARAQILKHHVFLFMYVPFEVQCRYQTQHFVVKCVVKYIQ
ncbi:hypothetical protein E3N88_14997 [Mikania micrantha]|uniref:Uncharacterized protein n=1 Tax=Mikania micrantha TaxID=192012 RepID=A0A5N6P4C5_9ASTR|nr:hypothetical protein E3N88_14992 [Mikania micrantha]KAD5803637.1 hypothetical protein E3N88_14997 [Mikania micrantha]